MAQAKIAEDEKAEPDTDSLGTNPYDMDSIAEDECPYTLGMALPESVTESYIGRGIDTRIPSIERMSKMNGRQLADMADYFNSDVNHDEIRDSLRLHSETGPDGIAWKIAATSVLE